MSKADHEGDFDSEFLLEAELARRWRRSLRTLQRWRSQGVAPEHLIIEGRVLYRRRTIEIIEDAATVGKGGAS